MSTTKTADFGRKTVLLRVIALASIAASAVTAALAAPETGTRFDRAPLTVKPGQLVDDNAGRIVANQFARCVANQKRSASVTMMALPYLSDEQSKSAAKLFSGVQDCIGYGGYTLRSSTPAMVAGVAEQLIEDLYRRGDVGRFAGLSDEAALAMGIKPRNDGEDFAQCVVRRDPKAAKLVIATKPASKEETTQVGKMIPHLGPCLIQGQDLKLNVPSVRAIAAVGLYQLLSAAPGAQAAR